MGRWAFWSFSPSCAGKSQKLAGPPPGSLRFVQHEGQRPAELDVERFEDVQLKQDATSPYDYTNYMNRQWK